MNDLVITPPVLGLLSIAMIMPWIVAFLLFIEFRKGRVAKAALNDRVTMFNLISHHMTDLLTGIKWHGEMLGDSQAKKSKLSHDELVGRMMEGVQNAIKLNRRFLVLTKENREKALCAEDKKNVEKLLEMEAGLKRK